MAMTWEAVGEPWRMLRSRWPPGEGELLGTTVSRLSRPELSLLEFEVQPGGGVQPHFHKLHSDSFFVLAGELEFHLGDEVVHAISWHVRARSAGSRPLLPEHRLGAGQSSQPAYAGGLRGVPTRARCSPFRGEKPDAAFFERHDIYDVD